MNCPACGHENPDRAKFCLECGAAFATRCARCDTELPAGARFCLECGQPVDIGALKPDRTPCDYTPKHLADKILRSKSALEGERKQVTVLFADVKGSMELAEQVDPEEWHRILDRFFQILADGVHRFEGTVNQYTGDGIMALFGAPIAHEDHAQRACWAALHLRDELRRYGDELRLDRGISFAVRMGVNSGEVIVGKIGADLRMDYTAQGQAVGLAARMQQIAEPGKVYLTQHAARLVEGFFQLRDLGQPKVKGAAELLHVYELEGAGPSRTRLDVARLRGFSRFVGRADEMATLELAFKRAAEGNGQVVGVVGEAGVGKSRLCLEFVEGCRVRGTPVHEGHCPAHGKTIPFLPLLELLHNLFDISGRDRDHDARRKIAGELLLLDRAFDETLPLVFEFLGVPDPQRPAPQMAPEARQRQLFAFVQRLIRARSEREPAVLLVDDLHWIDPGSDTFLARIVEAVIDTRTLLLVNFRPEYEADWAHKSHYQQLPLLPLGPEGIEELLCHLLGEDPSVAELVEPIRERTKGNPFFIEEVVQSLAESGSLEGTRGAYRRVTPVAEVVVPTSVHTVLSARIDRLSERDKQLLQTAAVIGKEFSQPILEAIAELPSRDLADALATLSGAELIREEALYPVAEYSFKHPLTQEVALGSQLQERRRRTHAAVARAIEAQSPEKLDENAALLAHHFEKGGEALDAMRWHGRAAEWASRSDPVEGLRHWRRVVELGREEPASSELDAMRLEGCGAFALGGSWRLGLAPEELEALVAEGEEIAQRLGDSATHAVLLAADAARLCVRLGRPEESIEVARRALVLAASSGDRELHAGIQAALTHVLASSGRLEEALQSAREECELCGSDPNLGVRVVGYGVLLHGLDFQAETSALLGQIEEARVLAERCLAMAREAGQRERIGVLAGSTVFIAFLAGDREGARGRDVQQTALEAVEIADELGNPYQRHDAYRYLGLAHLLHDRPEDAVSWVERSLASEYLVALDLEGWARAWLAAARLAAGDLHGARCAADHAVEVTAERRLRVQECLARMTLARVLMADAGAAEAERIEATLDAAEALVAETGARVLSPQITERRGELAGLRGELTERERFLREAHRLYTEIGATGHAERLARELGL